MKFVLRDYQQEASDRAISFFQRKTKRNGLMVLPTGCHAKGSLLLMYDLSLKKVENIKVNDCLLGPDGERRTVKSLHRGKDMMFEVSVAGFDKFIVNGGHILSLYNKVDNINIFISVYDYLSESKDFKELFLLKRYSNENTITHERGELHSFSIKKLYVDSYYGFSLDKDHLYLDYQKFIHHNSGKSLIIADIASRVQGNLIVLQPSKEILEQNFSKLRSYGIECSIYSASMNRKEISRITFATIGSIIKEKDLFNNYSNIIVDECHTCNASGGMFKDFFDNCERKILGLTATPYRLSSAKVSLDENGYYNPECVPDNYCILKFLTRTRPRIFYDLLYEVSIQKLLSKGFLANLRYFDLSIIQHKNLKRNTTGKDFVEKDLAKVFESHNMSSYLVDIVKRLLAPKNGIKRKGILVFTRFLTESEFLCKNIESCVMISGNTKKSERENILRDFKDGKIKVVANVGVLTTGFDYPELDTVVLARPTMSLALYYQIVGRIIRPFKNKIGWVVDLCGNINRFGKVEDLYITEPKQGEYMVRSRNIEGRDKQLTNTYF